MYISQTCLFRRRISFRGVFYPLLHVNGFQTSLIKCGHGHPASPRRRQSRPWIFFGQIYCKFKEKRLSSFFRVAGCILADSRQEFPKNTDIIKHGKNTVKNIFHIDKETDILTPPSTLSRKTSSSAIGTMTRWNATAPFLIF